jgi:hypothetical protein
MIDSFSSDDKISDYLGLSFEKYANMLTSEYNAYMHDEKIYIKNEEDIIKLRIWFKENMEQLIIARILTNNIASERK